MGIELYEVRPTGQEKILYISGGFTKVKNPEEAFKRVQTKLEAKGEHPINPALIKLPEGVYGWDGYMRATTSLLLMSNAIYMMKDWSDSAGSGVELGIALALGYPVEFEDATLEQCEYRKAIQIANIVESTELAQLREDWRNDFESRIALGYALARGYDIVVVNSDGDFIKAPSDKYFRTIFATYKLHA